MMLVLGYMDYNRLEIHHTCSGTKVLKLLSFFCFHSLLDTSKAPLEEALLAMKALDHSEQ
jgi:hypothetical protein